MWLEAENVVANLRRSLIWIRITAIVAQLLTWLAIVPLWMSYAFLWQYGHKELLDWVLLVFGGALIVLLVVQAVVMAAVLFFENLTTRRSRRGRDRLLADAAWVLRWLLSASVWIAAGSTFLLVLIALLVFPLFLLCGYGVVLTGLTWRIASGVAEYSELPLQDLILLAEGSRARPGGE